MTPPAAAERSAKPPTKQKGEPQAEPTWPPPLKPRPRLFVALMIVLVVWVGVLLWMYFTKNLPRAAPATKPAAPALA